MVGENLQGDLLSGLIDRHDWTGKTETGNPLVKALDIEIPSLGKFEEPIQPNHLIKGLVEDDEWPAVSNLSSLGLAETISDLWKEFTNRFPKDVRNSSSTLLKTKLVLFPSRVSTLS